MSTAVPTAIEQVKRLAARYLGRVPYEQALRLQQQTWRKRACGEICDTLLLLEHESVFTMGRRDSRAHLLRDEALLGAPLLRCNRGGELTYHGPGQLIGYFHARLSEMGGKKTEADQKNGFGVKALVFGLEEAIILLLRERYGLKPWRDLRHRGVWLGEKASKTAASGLNKKKYLIKNTFLNEHKMALKAKLQNTQNTPKIGTRNVRKIAAQNTPDGNAEIGNEIAAKIGAKIAALGVSIQQGVSMHGFALNISTDLRFFEQIIPCGIADRGVTSLEVELKREFKREYQCESKSLGHSEKSDCVPSMPSVKDMANELLPYFCAVFGYAPVALEADNFGFPPEKQRAELA